MVDAEFQPLPPYEPAWDLQLNMDEVIKRMMESCSHNWPQLVGTPKSEPNKIFEMWEQSHGKNR